MEERRGRVLGRDGCQHDKTYGNCLQVMVKLLYMIPAYFLMPKSDVVRVDGFYGRRDLIVRKVKYLLMVLSAFPRINKL